MSLQLQWTGRSDLDRIAEIRWRCYSVSGGMKASMRTRAERGAWADGDVCIASQDGEDVGTATSLSMHLHARGKRVPCQGVAWVGTAKSHRRKRPSDQAGERGVASQVMTTLQQKARERGEIVSALMPFRVSFYEHFGYGVVERQNVWTIPLALLPDGPAEAAWRFGSASNADAMLACRARQAAAGQCDVETSPAQMREWLAHLDADTQLFVDGRGDRTAAHAWLRTSSENEQYIATVTQPAWEDFDGFRSVLGLLRGLRDQYSFARLSLPVDWPLHWLLAERQIPHRPVDHASATCRQITRMQLRVLDPVKFLDGQQLAAGVRGKVVFNVHTIDKTKHAFALSIEDGRVTVAASQASADVECDEVAFAALCTGGLPAGPAAALKLIDVATPGVMQLLAAFGAGPQPFCYEYF